MAEINPNPYKDGDPLGPTGRVTAIFDNVADLRSAGPEIENAGYKGADFAMFIGSEAADKLDSNGEARDIVGLKMFQNAVCDEIELFDQFETALKSGGAVVAVRTGDDEEKKTALVKLLKAHHARKINYWGKWHFDAVG